VAPVRYTVAFPAPHTHYVDVKAVIDTGGADAIELMMAVWTPGSYLIREFSRHVEAVAARAPDGTALRISKTRKNRWRVETGDAPQAIVTYRVYGREMSVRTNWIDADFALLNGAATFMTPVEALRAPHEVTIEPARGWTRAFTALRAIGEHRFLASDFDRLVDSPILLGNQAAYEFDVDGTPHLLVNECEAGIFDGARAARDVERIVCQYKRMWGTLPYERYLFLNLITEAGGGLEHADSCVLMTTRWTTRTRRAYLAWLGLVSHEFFHVWNVKRLRPAELGPFDYECENHTRSLWVAEGFTDYYTDLMVHRAGLSTTEEYLEALSSKIESLQTMPGRELQSAASASFDAWIKHYRPDENSANTSISYYTKGAVLAFLLDARIRAASAGSRSLDDVVLQAYAQYSGDRGFTSDQIRSLIERFAGEALDDFWRDAVDGTSELDYSGALETFGLTFRGGVRVLPSRAWLGATLRNEAGRLLVSQVRRGGPAHHAGLNVDDEVIAIDGIRVRAERIDERLEQYRNRDRVNLLVARRERLRSLDLVFGEEPPRQWQLQLASGASAMQSAQLARWLSGSADLNV
jgi:predicted metalloprotease with PDZ domain